VLVAVVVLAGLIGTMYAWRLIHRGRPVWKTLPPFLGLIGAMSLLLMRTIDAPPPGGTNVPGTGGVLAIGLLSGALLYLATRVFVLVALRVPSFARQTRKAYEDAATADVRRELVLSLLLAVPGEELLWRGLGYRWGAEELPSVVAAAVLVWVLYVIANVPSRSLPIIAGALVGGAVWGALAWWSGGVLAPLASHILWTGAMLSLPPTVADTERMG
jgi:membrane protease YdiL (CAAX protease family)